MKFFFTLTRKKMTYFFILTKYECFSSFSEHYSYIFTNLWIHLAKLINKVSIFRIQLHQIKMSIIQKFYLLICSADLPTTINDIASVKVIIYIDCVTKIY